MAAQIPDCAFDTTMAPPANLPDSYCGSVSPLDYVPGPNDDVKTIDIVVNVMQREDPLEPQNFSNTTEHLDAIRSYLFEYGSIWIDGYPVRQLLPSTYDGEVHAEHPYLSDGKIEFNIVEINFWQDDQGWNNNNSPCGSYNFNLYKRTKDYTDAALMIYLVEGITVSNNDSTYLWDIGGCGQSGYIILHGLYKTYVRNGYTGAPYTPNWAFIRELFVHEIGHSIGGLSHTFGGGCFADIIPCPTYSDFCDPYTLDPATPNCSNNIMSYAASRRYFSFTQHGKIHQNLSRSPYCRFVHHSLDTSGSDIYVDSSQAWITDRFVNGNIYIEAGATLTINSTVYMPPSGRIIVKRGARLMADCGRITTCRDPLNSLHTNSNGDYWGGIEVWGNTAVAHAVDMRDEEYEQVSSDPGIVLLRNAEISNALVGIATMRRDGTDWLVKKTYFGGFVFATDSTVFRNNRKSAEFYAYPYTNYSGFEGCYFDDHPEDRPAVTIWATDGIVFRDCAFENIYRQGILSFDAFTEVYGCHFNAVRHGVESYGSFPMSSGIIVGGDGEEEVGNTFVNCPVGVYLDATGDARVYRNIFSGSSNHTGISAQGPIGYQIAGNQFSGVGTGISNFQTLMFGPNLMDCNTFSGNSKGIVFSGNNLGCVLNYNTFEFKSSGVTSNVIVQNATDAFNLYKGAIREIQQVDDNEHQGEGFPAGNIFGAGPGGVKRHVVSSINNNTTVSFTYYSSNPFVQPRVFPICGVDDTLYCNGLFSAQNFQYKTDPQQLFDSTHCASFAGLISGCDSPSCYAVLKSDHEDAIEENELNPSEETLHDLAIKRSARFTALRNLMKAYIRGHNYAAFSDLVRRESHDFGRRAMMWYFVEREDWSGARQYLDSFPVQSAEDSAFVDIQHINIDRLESGLAYELSGQDEARLREIADGVLPDRSFARALLVHLLDTIFEPEIIDDSIGLRSWSGVDSTFHPSSPSENIRIIPNPGRDVITLEFPSSVKSVGYNQLYIHDLSGKYYETIVENIAPLRIRIGELPPGMYILTLVNAEGNRRSLKFIKS